MNGFTLSEAERLVKLETQMQNIEHKVDEGFARADNRFDSLEKTMKDFIDKSEERFANKWVEKAIWIVVTSGLGAIVVATLKSIEI